jgi:hypothetical protein
VWEFEHATKDHVAHCDFILVEAILPFLGEKGILTGA